MNRTEGSKANQLTIGCSQQWAQAILRRFCDILADNRCGMKLDLIEGEDGEAKGMLLVLTAGQIPHFSISYEATDDQSRD